MNGDEFCAIRESGFDLDVVNHFGNAFHHFITGNQSGAITHELGDGFSIACAFENFRSDECDDFGVIQLQSAIAAAAGEVTGNDDQQLFLFARGKVHQSAWMREIEPRASKPVPAIFEMTGFSSFETAKDNSAPIPNRTAVPAVKPVV